MSAPLTRAGRSRWHHSGQTKNCEVCHSEFRRLANTAAKDWDRRRFCSMTCVNINRRRVRQPTERRYSRIFIPRQPWAVDAACADTDVEFVPDSKAEAAEAIAVCFDCPVRAQCLVYGLAVKATGVWGGEWLDPWRPTRKGGVM